MARIVVTGRIPSSAHDLLERAHPGHVRVFAGDPPSVDELAAELTDAEALVAVWYPVRRELLERAPRLKVVANTAVGFDNIDVAECARRGVTVTNTPGVLTDATADVAFGLMLAVTRRLAEGDRLIRRGQFPLGFSQMLGVGLRGRQLGVIGMGTIGQAVARRGRVFGMTVVYNNRRQLAPEIEKELGARLVELDELLATSDIVSLNCPYTPETHHLLDARALALMQPTAFVINTARGKVIDEAALVDALVDGRLAGAGLDVFEFEPEVHPKLLALDQVVLTPHIGSATSETRGAMAELAARNVLAVLAGQPPVSPVPA